MKCLIEVDVADNLSKLPPANRLDAACELESRLEQVLNHSTAREAIATGMNADVSLRLHRPCPITFKSLVAERKAFMEILEEFVRTMEQPGSPVKKLAQTYRKACRALHHKPIISEAPYLDPNDR